MKLSLTALIASLVLLSAATPVLADTVEQDQDANQKFEVKCESGSYGSQNCYVTGEQNLNQHQKVTLANNVLGYTTRAAGLNTTMITALAAVLLAGAGATAHQLKNKAK